MVVDPLSGRPVTPADTCALELACCIPGEAKKAKHQERMCAGFHRRDPAGVLNLGSRNEVAYRSWHWPDGNRWQHTVWRHR